MVYPLNSNPEPMRAIALSVALLMLSLPLAGCISEEGEDPDKEWIEDDSDLLELEDSGICGDLDGDGELDCPLTGYIPETMPWWCNSTGIGGHHVDPFYEGMEKGPLSFSQCETLTEEFQAALGWASQWPTLADAEAAGFHMLVGYTEGMGTHHTMLNDFMMSDEDFDTSAPEFPGTSLDEEFDYSQPEFLMFAGEEPDSELVGFAWLVHAPADSPPEGFTGDNDWWHRHDSLCFQIDAMLVMGEDLTEDKCSDRGGENVALEEYWMAHAWIVRPWLTHEDVFTNHHPCLTDEGAIEDPEDDCWLESTGHVGHDIE